MEALLNQRKKEYEVAESLFKKGFRSEVKLSQSLTNFEISRILPSLSKTPGFTSVPTLYPVSYTHLTLPTNREV